MKQLLLVLSIIWNPLFAGWEFVSETRATDGKGNVIQKMIVQSMVEGDNGKFIFQEATGSPMTPTGNYLITNDGGMTMFLVDPINKTYTPFDLGSMMKLAGSMMNMVQGVVKMEYSDPVIETLEESEGEKLQGLPTMYTKTRTTFEMRMKILGMKRVIDSETLQETWTTTKLGDSAFGAWLRDDPAPTGNEDLDRLITSQMKEIKGYPLKMIQTTKTITWNKKKTKVKREETSQSQTVVTKLQKKGFEDSTFKIPDGYVMNETPQDQGGLDSLKNIFKGDN